VPSSPLRSGTRRVPDAQRGHLPNFSIVTPGRRDAQAYPFTNAFNFHQAPLRPARMIYRKRRRDAYYVNLAEGRGTT
jgi:hypothetical protein